MIKVSQAYVKYHPSNFKSEAGKTYLLFVPDYGSIGDKFDMGPSSTGLFFPEKASERFAFKKDAERIKTKFLRYCNAKIEDVKYKKFSHKNSGVDGGRNPGYFYWE